MAGPLDDLRVIDLSSGPAPGIATMVLADFGADVIKVERPGGDPFRALPSSPMWLRGKRSVELDLTSAAARAQLHELVRGADVVMASYAPGEAVALGADAATLRGLSPGLVYCSLTGWGEQGPYAHYPAYEGVVAAKSGRMRSFAGLTPRTGPVFSAVQVGVHASAQAAVQGILGALIAREQSGEGQLVETSLLQGMIPYDMNGLIREQLAARNPAAFGADPLAERGRMPTLNYHPVMTKDGRWIQLGNLLEHLFYSYVAAADLIEFIVDERFQGAPGGWPEELREYARDRMLERMQERTLDEWMQAFYENGNVAAEPFLPTQDGLQHPDLLLNGDVVETDHPRLGRVRQLGLAGRLTETPGHVASSEPLAGEHTAEVLAEAPRPSRPHAPSGGAPRYPLEGVTVLELSTIIATPLAASFLGDMGARVIKVEPVDGDPYRNLGGGPASGIGAAKTNVSKESICVDLKTEEGRAIVRGLLARSDAVMHNYRPGVPERLGIGWEDARTLNPRIVYVSSNGYGPDGPGAARPCAHPIPGAALGGALYQAGLGHPPERCESVAEVREAARRLMRANEVNPDPNTSMVAATATILGLYAAKRLGVGQRVFSDMMGANAYANHDDAISYEGKPPRPALDGECYGLGALYRLYEAGSGWVFLGVVTEAEWRAFCGATGRDALASDPRFATAEARQAHDAELTAELAALFSTAEADEWERRLIAVGVGCVRADGPTPGAFWAHDEHVKANGLAPEAEHAVWGRYQRHGPIVKFDRLESRLGPAENGGGHTDALLAELGYDGAAIADLRARGVVGSIGT